jgi:hypothetical protein
MQASLWRLRVRKANGEKREKVKENRTESKFDLLLHVVAGVSWCLGVLCVLSLLASDHDRFAQ